MAMIKKLPPFFLVVVVVVVGGGELCMNTHFLNTSADDLGSILFSQHLCATVAKHKQEIIYIFGKSQIQKNIYHFWLQTGTYCFTFVQFTIFQLYNTFPSNVLAPYFVGLSIYSYILSLLAYIHTFIFWTDWNPSPSSCCRWPNTHLTWEEIFKWSITQYFMVFLLY